MFDFSIGPEVLEKVLEPLKNQSVLTHVDLCSTCLNKKKTLTRLLTLNFSVVYIHVALNKSVCQML